MLNKKPFELALAFGLNYSEFPDSCFQSELSFAKYILNTPTYGAHAHFPASDSEPSYFF